ncbi:hypothetical protein FIA58_010535 [Flavobacterium jejuense]|uniref:Lipoprotein n=1 Tax=Flavobacterium jejuense TaxID=1544455 RepID=A0ABX0IUA2_9FLAO|nr:hypothetical protein [Flavobacterium jejuense]NHN26113.1 hypothetical protein [Flavobacterium jejuense]
MKLKNMKYWSRIVVIVFVFLSCNTSFSQVKQKNSEKEIEKLNCTKNSNIRLEERLVNFPYNLTAQIKIVSYKNKEEGGVGDDFQKYLDLLVTKKDTIIENKFDEMKVLNLEQIEKLTDIIFNYGYESEPTIEVAEACYMPRNAILFYDNDNKIIGFIEICFQCSNYRTNDNKMNLGETCTQKFELLKAFFKECGIQYGTIEM